MRLDAATVDIDDLQNGIIHSAYAVRPSARLQSRYRLFQRLAEDALPLRGPPRLP
jgi:hypothetical protein